MGGGQSNPAGVAQTEQIPQNLFNQAAGSSLFDINSLGVGGQESGGGIFSGSYDPFSNVPIPSGYNPNATPGVNSSGGAGVYGGGAATGGGQTPGGPAQGLPPNYTYSAAGAPAGYEFAQGPGNSPFGSGGFGGPGNLVQAPGGQGGGGGANPSAGSDTFYNAGKGNTGLDLFNALAPELGNLYGQIPGQIGPGSALNKSFAPGSPTWNNIFTQAESPGSIPFQRNLTNANSPTELALANSGTLATPYGSQVINSGNQQNALSLETGGATALEGLGNTVSGLDTATAGAETGLAGGLQGLLSGIFSQPQQNINNLLSYLGQGSAATGASASATGAGASTMNAQTNAELAPLKAISGLIGK